MRGSFGSSEFEEVWKPEAADFMGGKGHARGVPVAKIRTCLRRSNVGFGDMNISINRAQVTLAVWRYRKPQVVFYLGPRNFRCVTRSEQSAGNKFVDKFVIDDHLIIVINIHYIFYITYSRYSFDFYFHFLLVFLIVNICIINTYYYAI